MTDAQRGRELRGEPSALMIAADDARRAMTDILLTHQSHCARCADHRCMVANDLAVLVDKYERRYSHFTRLYRQEEASTAIVDREDRKLDSSSGRLYKVEGTRNK